MFLQTSSTSATRRPDATTFLQYLGTYTKVPITRTTLELDEWLSLPMGCRTAWLQRILTSTDSEIRAIHARVSIRNKRRHGPPPSLDETEEWLKNNPGRRQGIKIVPLRAAFESGEEKLEFEVVKFVKYDADMHDNSYSEHVVARSKTMQNSQQTEMRCLVTFFSFVRNIVPDTGR
ncbi:hypothetical protein BC826DRAFT_714931 [Russula brevipes]|nr:hypothetical protein BC826DRAFT_714931 [Russula brevipes]